MNSFSQIQFSILIIVIAESVNNAPKSMAQQTALTTNLKLFYPSIESQLITSQWYGGRAAALLTVNLNVLGLNSSEGYIGIFQGPEGDPESTLL